MFLMVKADWPGPFRRAVRDGSGAITAVLEFAPGKVYEVLDTNLAAVSGDIGKALLEVALTETGRPRIIADAAIYPTGGIEGAPGAEASAPTQDPGPPLTEPPEALPVDPAAGAEDSERSESEFLSPADLGGSVAPATGGGSGGDTGDVGTMKRKRR